MDKLEGNKAHLQKKARSKEPEGREGKNANMIPKPRNFLKVLMAARTQNQTMGKAEGHGKQPHTHKPVRKKIQRLEYKLRQSTTPSNTAKQKIGPGGQGRQSSPYKSPNSQEYPLTLGGSQHRQKKPRQPCQSQRGLRQKVEWSS